MAMTFYLGPYRFGFSHDLIRNEGKAYLERWVVWFGGSLRIHRFLASDADRAMHDHPCWFLSLPLHGYLEFTPDDGAGRQVRAWRLHWRASRLRHRVTLLRVPTWTLVLTGSPTREWGFWEREAFTHHDDWLDRDHGAG
ncbi:MAG: hypothetical protein KDI31_09960 [Pseudomonadales bacterium]|nr:hypothetical protein [Pseudomonadales bacterium]